MTTDKYIHPADILVKYMTRVYKQGLTTTSGGNFSVMDTDGNIWITPSGIDKGSLTKDDITMVKQNGEIVGKHKPSMELPFHKKMYEYMPDMKAVLHAHPPALVSLSLMGLSPMTNIMASHSRLTKKISICEYDLPGSLQLGKKVSDLFNQGADAVMMNNHGVTVCAPSMQEAFFKFELLEQSAVIALESEVLGGAKSLSESQIKKYNAIKSKIKVGQVDDSVSQIDIRKSIVNFCTRSYAQKYFYSTTGTYAVRDGEDSFLISDDSVDKSRITPFDITKVQNGVAENTKGLGKYADIIAQCFSQHSDIGAVSVSEPACAMAFGVSGVELNSKTIPESYIMMRQVQRVTIDEFLQDPFIIAKKLSNSSPVVIVDNMAMFTCGQNITKCFDSQEVCDMTAKTLIYAKRLERMGNVLPITQDKVKEIEDTFF